MRSRLVTIVQERRTHWIREWEPLLRAEPVLAAMAEPAILARSMEETFAQFRSLLHSPPGRRWLHTHPPNFGRVGGSCRCGLSPLLAYFATGQLALETVLRIAPAVPAPHCAELTAIWHFLAQREIESLCGACRRVCAPALVVAGRDAGDFSSGGEG